MLLKLCRHNIDLEKNPNKNITDLHEKPLRYNWDEKCQLNYQKELEKQVEILKKSNTFYHIDTCDDKNLHTTNNNKEHIDSIFESINKIYLKAAEKNLHKQKKVKQNKPKLRDNSKKEFIKECSEARRKLKQVCQALSRNPKNSSLRGQFFKLKSTYKSFCRKRT